MPKVTEEHRQAMRERILQATASVATSKGLGALTMGDVIKESGLSAGAIYGYYKGKDELLVDLAQNTMGERRESLHQLATTAPVPPPSQGVMGLANGLPPAWIKGGLLLQFWGAAAAQPEILGHASLMLAQMQQDMDGYLQAWLVQEGVDADEAARRTQVVTPSVTGLVQGYLVRAALIDEEQRIRYLESMEATLAMIERSLLQAS